MGWYRERPALTQARQFTGGVDNATNLIDWIQRKGGDAAYQPAIPPYVDPEGKESHDGLPEMIRIENQDTYSPRFTRARVGDWIVKTGDERKPFIVIDDASFIALYEEVTP